MKVYNEERIEHAIQNYTIRPKVEKDFDRVKKPTESLKNKKTEFDKADKITLNKNTGFSVD